MGTKNKPRRGGEKTGSGAGGTAKKKGEINSVADATTLQELADFMFDKHDMRVDLNSLKDVPLENVKEVAEAIVFIREEFPKAVYNFHELGGKLTKENAYAAASFDGVININPQKFGKDNLYVQRYENDVRNGFHPAGTKPMHIGTHEAGHILERALIDKYINEPGILGRIAQSEAWDKSTMAKKVISEAAKAAKKMPGGKGKKNAQLINDVSRYSNKNRSETLAECVADYVANRNNAKPLSIATWNILKRELG